MTAINWANSVSGDWTEAADWSTGAIPTSADNVTISAPGAYMVTVGSAIVIHVGRLPSIFPTANSLTFNASEAALVENTGELTVAGALTVDSGSALSMRRTRSAASAGRGACSPSAMAEHWAAARSP